VQARGPGSILRLQLFALVTIAGAISLNTAIYIGLLTNTPKPDNPATIAEPPPTPDKSAFRVVAHAAVHGMKPETASTTARLRPGDVSPAKGANDAPAKQREICKRAILTFTVPPLPIRKRARTAIPRSEAPLPPTRAAKKVESRIAGSNTHHQIGRASWYRLDSVTASGEKMDDAALTAAHRFLPFGTKVRVENTANGRSVEVRINDRGPFIPGRMIDLSKAAAEALDIMADGVAEVRLSVIDAVASADHG
jgi:rare lipoprotein A